MMQLQKEIKVRVRGWFLHLAKWLDKSFGNKITPDGITYVGLLAHIPIAILIAQGHLIIGGLLLIVFGLFDTLDGALAKVRGSASAKGMFLDASTDRLKEAILYVGFVYFFVDNNYAIWAPLVAIIACGLSLSVSYVKAKGEAAIATLDKSISHEKLNRIFEDGIGSFEMRMALLVVGCLSGYPQYFIAIIIAMTMNTLVVRMRLISKALS